MKLWKPAATPCSALALALLFLCSLQTQLASAQQAPSDDLKKEIQDLRESLKAIQKDVQDIKALLQSRPGAAPPPTNVLLDLANNPFKGERTAKLTMVEFTDYQ